MSSVTTTTTPGIVLVSMGRREGDGNPSLVFFEGDRLGDTSA